MKANTMKEANMKVTIKKNTHRINTVSEGNVLINAKYSKWTAKALNKQIYQHSWKHTYTATMWSHD